MSFKINFWKLFLIGVVILLFIILLNKCNSCSFIKKPKSDTISIKHDTIYIPYVHDTTYVPKIQTQVTYKPVYVTQKDTLNTLTIQFRDVDTVEILKDYFAKNIYSDTQKIQYGKVIIKDTVSQNKIQSRQFSITQNIPTITNTVTLTQPKKIIGYIGFSGLGTTHNLGAGIDFSLKTKNDKIYSIGENYFLKNWITQINYKIPIRLKK